MIPQRFPLSIQTDILVSPFTTINLGGRAKYFAECKTLDNIHEAVNFARQRHLKLQVLGGGSNIIFSDNGFDGLLVRIMLKGISFSEESGATVVTSAAGEAWDLLVQQCVERGLGGIECLSGIPGLVGATPIQNVGAYGQEVQETVVSVKAIDRNTLATIEFSTNDCLFGYRQSRFKSGDADRYIITEVTFRLQNHGRPEIRYEELRTFIASSTRLKDLPDGQPALAAVREAVIALRKRKSMLVDPTDLNSRSVGSFFTNPILSREAFAIVEQHWKSMGGDGAVPGFPSGDKIKTSAAWLVEKTGFVKGYVSGGVGISRNHTLALVNYNGTALELLTLAGRIQRVVHERFGVALEREPVVVAE